MLIPLRLGFVLHIEVPCRIILGRGRPGGWGAAGGGSGVEGAGAVAAAGAVVPGVRVNHSRMPEMKMRWR